MPLRQVLELMADISGRRVRRIQVNGKVAEMVTATLEFIADHVTRRPPSGTAEGVRIALRAGALSIEKAQRELGYAPGPVEPVLRETIAHLLDAGHNQTEWGSTPSTRRSTVSRRAPVWRLIQSHNTVRDMLNDPGQWLAFVWSGWTTTWPTQLLAIIWILWVISWVVASFWSGQTKKHVMTSDSLKYRSPILVGADSLPAIDRQGTGRKAALAVWQPWHLRAGVPYRLPGSRSHGGREFISDVSGRTRSRTRKATRSLTPAPTGLCATRSIRGLSRECW